MARHAKLRAKHVWGGGRGPARVGRRAWTPVDGRERDGQPLREEPFVMLSHGLPRSSGILAQIRVSGFSLLYHRLYNSLCVW